MKHNLVNLEDIEPSSVIPRSMDINAASDIIASPAPAISVQGGKVINGHMRLKAALDLGCDVEVQDILTKERYYVTKGESGDVVRVDADKSSHKSRRPGPR